MVGLRQKMSDLPEHERRRGELLANGERFDDHMIGGHVIGYSVACPEAVLLDVVGHRLYGNDSCTHEIAHAIEVGALAPDVRERLVALYERSLAAGRWRNDYAARSYAELFAEATRHWFDDRALLETRDPDALAFVRDLYQDDLDPGPAPTEQAIRPGPASDEGRIKSAASRRPVRVRLQNETAATVRVQWLDFEGRRDSRTSADRLPTAHANGDVIDLATFAGHAFLVSSLDGTALATFVAPSTDAFVSLP